MLKDRMRLHGWVTRCRRFPDGLYLAGITLKRPKAPYLSMVWRFRKDPLLCQGF